MRALALLLLLQNMPAASPMPVPRVVETSRRTTGALAERVLDIAFAEDSTLLVLAPEALASYRIDGDTLKLVERVLLPGPLRPVRVPGGMLLQSEGGASCWALTSSAPRAVLFEVAHRRLEVHGEAEALPWPGLVDGVRFRAGTNLLDAALPGVDGPLLRLLAGDETFAVGTHGELWRAGHSLSAPRVGPALTPLWPGVLAAASPAAPGPTDEVLVLAADGPQPEIVSRLTVPGAVRALASRPDGRSRVLAAAIEAPVGVFRVVLIDLVQAAP